MTGQRGDDLGVVVTISSPGRQEHVVHQHQLLASEHSGWRHLLVRLGAPGWEPWDRCWAIDVPVDGPLPLAAARNAGLDTAVAGGADTIVALDADCVVLSPSLDCYRDALAAYPDAVACGPVTYLDDGVLIEPNELERATNPHPVRPAPREGEIKIASDEEYSLFWSLSFALTAFTWRNLRKQKAGFTEEYRGYGAEDTDFGRRLRALGTRMVWAGGAHTYHQFHPVSFPPVEHLEDIIRNGEIFAREWGFWPMTGWLNEFEQAGLIERDNKLGWRIVG